MVDSQKRIAGAFLVGTVLVAGAFVMSKQETIERASVQNAVAKVPERSHIDITDSNKDGIPDWQDALLKTNPIIISTSSTSTYEGPKTITGKFGIDFFKEYTRAKTYGAFGDTNEEIAAKAVEKVSKQAIDELFTTQDITIFPYSDEETLTSYGNHIASILLAHPNDGDSEAIILQDYMNYHDKSRLTDLDPIALAYTTMVKEMLEAPVPEPYVQKHLNVLNALNAIREDVRSMQKVDEDALYTLLRMKRYEDDVLGLSNALLALFNALYFNDNIRWSESEPVSQLMTFTE